MTDYIKTIKQVIPCELTGSFSHVEAYEVELQNFWHIPCKPNECIRTENFERHGLQWYLEICPRRIVFPNADPTVAIMLKIDEDSMQEEQVLASISVDVLRPYATDQIVEVTYSKNNNEYSQFKNMAPYLFRKDVVKFAAATNGSLFIRAKIQVFIKNIPPVAESLNLDDSAAAKSANATLDDDDEQDSTDSDSDAPSVQTEDSEDSSHTWPLGCKRKAREPDHELEPPIRKPALAPSSFNPTSAEDWGEAIKNGSSISVQVGDEQNPIAVTPDIVAAMTQAIQSQKPVQSASDSTNAHSSVPDSSELRQDGVGDHAMDESESNLEEIRSEDGVEVKEPEEADATSRGWWKL